MVETGTVAGIGFLSALVMLVLSGRVSGITCGAPELLGERTMSSGMSKGSEAAVAFRERTWDT